MLGKNMNIIDFENINVGYDEKIILKDITLKIKEKDVKDILKEICISDDKMQLIIDKLKM